MRDSTDYFNAIYTRPRRSLVVFTEFLEDKANYRRLEKKERTKILLMAAAARNLITLHPSEITVDGIVSDAFLSRGTFYKYFSSIDDILFDVMKEFKSVIWTARPVYEHSIDLRSRIFKTNKFYSHLYQVNSSLFRASYIYSLYNEQFANIASDINLRSASVQTRLMIKRYGDSIITKTESELFGTIRILLAASDETLRARFVNEDSALIKAYPTASELADGLSVIWCRALLINSD